MDAEDAPDERTLDVPTAAPERERARLSLVELLGPLITIDEYARLVRRHRDTVYRWHADPGNRGPKGTLVGGKLLFRTADIEAYWRDLWLEQHGGGIS